MTNGAGGGLGYPCAGCTAAGCLVVVASVVAVVAGCLVGFVAFVGRLRLTTAMVVMLASVPGAFLFLTWFPVGKI